MEPAPGKGKNPMAEAKRWVRRGLHALVLAQTFMAAMSSTEEDRMGVAWGDDVRSVTVLNRFVLFDSRRRAERV
jgi:hypothetical protein